MEIKKTTERMLAYSLATEIKADELNHIAGGTVGATHIQSNYKTMGGQDHTCDTDKD